MKRLFICVIFLFFMATIAIAQNYNSGQVDPNAPENTVKIPGHDIYVKGQDEKSRMDWIVAKRTCECKGEGWRLPTIGELQVLYEYKDMFDNFSREYYWAYDQNPYNGRYYNLSFRNGRVSDEVVDENNKVRCVWSPFKQR